MVKIGREDKGEERSLGSPRERAEKERKWRREKRKTKERGLAVEQPKKKRESDLPLLLLLEKVPEVLSESLGGSQSFGLSKGGHFSPSPCCFL